jgi:hypothetical protein
MRIRDVVIDEPIVNNLREFAASNERWAEHYTRLAELIALLEALPPEDFVGAMMMQANPPVLLLCAGGGRSLKIQPDRNDGRAGVDAPLHFRLRIDRGEKQIADELRIAEPAAAAERIVELLTSGPS